jgi:signal peptidase I
MRFLLLIVLAALLLRTLIVAPFSIPSESMLPSLQIGDDLMVAKWPYGWSRHSFPRSIAPFSGRMLGRLPVRGDIVVFKNPADGRTDYIKRVIGLPGDRVAMRHGELILNGVAVPKLRVADLLVPVTAASPCRPQRGFRLATERQPDGTRACRYPRYRETLPGGRSHDVLDLGDMPAADDVATATVPAGHLFLLGDNRDRSADSRFPVSVGGIGMVPTENLIGRALLLFYSTDGSAEWLKPWTWWTAARGERIGGRL